jgi:hypothetical protein
VRALRVVLVVVHSCEAAQRQHVCLPALRHPCMVGATTDGSRGRLLGRLPALCDA